MRSKQRTEIKKVINELGRRAVELQAYRGSLIHQIRADPKYKHETLSALITSHSTLHREVEPEKQVHELRPFTLEMIQKLFLAEASIDRIHAKSAELCALIAPIHVLPDEILRIIFTEVACAPRPENNVLAHMSYAHRKTPPASIALASVSRRWRDLVIASPTLWTSINLSPWQPRSWSRLAIARSEAAPLNITLDCCVDTTPDSEVLHQLLEVVLPEIDRWEGIAVVAHHCYTLAYVGRLFSDLHAPNLRSLRLSLTGKGPPGDQSVIVPNLFQRGAPKLSHVYLYSVGLPWDTSVLLRGLTCLDLRWMWNETKLTYHQFRTILAACPDLKELVLRGLYVDLQAAAHYERLQVPSLRYLELSGNNVSRICSLLDVPGLQQLHLANVDETEYRELMQLFENAPERGKFPMLRSLRLLNVRMAQPSPAFLYAISNIEEMTIIHSVAARFLVLLRAQQGSGEAEPSVVLPRLQTLTLLDDVSDEVLLAIVGERAALGYPLQRLNVQADSVNDYYKQYLQQVVRLDGVHFQDQNH